MLSLVRPVYSLSEKKAVYTGVTKKQYYVNDYSSLSD